MLSKRLISQVRYFYTSPPKRSPIKRGLNVAFGKYLLATNIISSGALMGIGDIVQQEIEYQRNMLPKRYDYARMSRMFLVGLVFGPLHHYVYRWLNNVLPKRDMTSIGKKILFDQVAMSPLCILSFFYGMGVLEGRPMNEINTETKEKFMEVYIMDWSVWPASQFINFYFVPVKYQVFYINAITMLYNVFLSYIKHREIAEEYSTKIVKHV